jgi:hypothetical protein
VKQAAHDISSFFTEVCKCVSVCDLLMSFGFDSLLRLDLTLICSGIYGLFLRISFITLISLYLFSLDIGYY